MYLILFYTDTTHIRHSNAHTLAYTGSNAAFALITDQHREHKPSSTYRYVMGYHSALAGRPNHPHMISFLSLFRTVFKSLASLCECVRSFTHWNVDSLNDVLWTLDSTCRTTCHKYAKHFFLLLLFTMFCFMTNHFSMVFLSSSSFFTLLFVSFIFSMHNMLDPFICLMNFSIPQKIATNF